MASGNSDIISWEEYFMGVALLSARRSKDPPKKVGACIVNKNKRIVGLGYNGFPDNIPYNDAQIPWEKSSEKDADGNVQNKHLYVCHAEMNAIVNKLSVDITGCTMYTTLFPCNECAKLICQSRLGKVVYLKRKDEDDEGKNKAAENMFKMGGIQMVKYEPTRKIELEI
ncbi:deoxycytidylate deaminase-like [Mizuhopecten yessoensis]|uniref:deoxycytidylate deaminase-like n=1 Tax=Mizuhopecten yessoensis TaxID=6573 RepID=UPI000B459BCB|nr:deoxycytidylate deaminase-like [Mizuhopecten yessoensis]